MATHMKGDGFIAGDDFVTSDEEVPTLMRAGSMEHSGDGHRSGRRRRRKKRRHTGRIIAVILICILLAAAAIGGFAGFKLYQSARTVQNEAKIVMAQVDGAKKAIKTGDSQALQDVADTVNVSAHNIKDEVNVPIWKVASRLPVVGNDVKSVRALADVLVDLSDNALNPIASNANIMNLKDIFKDGNINVSVLQGIAGALDEAAPVLSRSADKLDALPAPQIDKVKDVLDKARTGIGEADEMVEVAQTVLPYLPAMVGANGQTRNYLVVAQNNSESRSTGGLPGSMGVLSITDGHFELGDFKSILHEEGLEVDARDDEKAFWATNFYTDPAQVTFLADFSRVGQLCRDFWAQSQGQVVDGVIAIDPVFLQHMIALTGRVDIPDGNGSWIDGTDAAKTLLNTVYVDWYPNNNAMQDEFFAQTAGAAAKSFFSNIGKASMTDLAKTVSADIEAHRAYAWMANEEEQALIERFNADGRVGDDPTAPEVGIYLNDSTYSKISWYAAFDVEVGNGTQNGDGTTTYPVRVGLTNTLTPEEGWALPRGVSGGNDEKRSAADMINRLFVLGPAGGHISDVVCESDETVSMGSCYGVEGFSSITHTDALETDTYTFNVTVPAEATQPLKVRTTPLGQEENLRVTYAWGDEG